MADRKDFEVGGRPLSTLRVVDLKLELEKRGLSKSGSKKDLVDRLKVQLRLEKLQEDASTDEGHVPNLRLQDEIAEQNDIIKDYLAKQQQTYEMQKEARRRVELEEQRIRDSSEASAGDTSQGEDESEVRPMEEKSPEETAEVPDVSCETHASVSENKSDETDLSSQTLPDRVSEVSIVSHPPETQDSTSNVEDEQKMHSSEPEAAIERVNEPLKPSETIDIHCEEAADSERIAKIAKVEMEEVVGQESKSEVQAEIETRESLKEENVDHVKEDTNKIPTADKDHNSNTEGIDVTNQDLQMKESQKEPEDGDVNNRDRAGSKSPSRDSQTSESRRSRRRSSSNSSQSSTSSRSRSSESQSSDSRSRSHKRSEVKTSEVFHTEETIEDSTSQSSVKPELEVKVNVEEEKIMDVEESSSNVDEINANENSNRSKLNEANPTADVSSKISTRKISLSAKSQINEESKENHENGEVQVPRKRKWGNSGAATAVLGKKASLSISTDSLKGLIPELKPVPIVNTGSGDSLVVIAEISETKSAPSSATPTIKRELIVFRSNSQNDKESAEKVEPPAKVARTLGRRTSANIKDSSPTKVTPSPARHPPSRIVHVRNLVRPFTLNQLKELLSKTGTLIEGGFWIDKIKSKCYVTYETEEQAVNTRQALHGTQWPSSNPKILSVDFATQDELDFHRNLAESELKPPLPPQMDTKVVVEAPIRIKLEASRSRKPEDEKSVVEKPRRDSQRGTERENKDKEQADEKDKRDDRSRNRQLQELNNNERERMRDRRDRDDHRGKDKGRQPPIREWDREKIGERSPGERERARTAHNRNRSRSRSRGPRGHPEIKDRNDRRREEEAPAKLLDDLFRKTKATPCIYWLPLTLEQIQMKDEQRKQRQVEREKRRQQTVQPVENLKSSQRSRSRDREESRNYRKSKSPAKSRNRRR